MFDMEAVRTQRTVAMLLHYGFTQAEIAFATGRSKSTIAYHMRTLGKPADERFNRRYDWAAVQAFYEAGNSISKCMAHFGFSRKTFNDARIRGAVLTRPQAMPLEQLLSRPRQRGHLKGRLLRLGLKVHRCEKCGISEWLGAPLSLALQHVNGDGKDNRLENLQLLCPNCHSQTENFAGRNVQRIRKVGA
jgi:5-methylcytosine-specific restriction endonuclease McrA